MKAPEPVVGFTGTRKGMTTEQRRTLNKFHSKARVFHHGACDGADTQAVQMFYSRGGWWIHAWPSHNPNAFAMAQSQTFHRPGTAEDGGWDPLVRNKLIVDASDILIATPGQHKELLRSGTWATVRYARGVRKPVYIIWPDGRTEKQ